MKVKDMKKPYLITVSPETSIAEAAKIMDAKDIGGIAVKKGEEIVGIMTERDILRKVVALEKNIKETKVKDIMTFPIVSIDEDAYIEQANQLMIEKKVRRLFTTKNGKVTGIITLRDISKNVGYILAQRIMRT